LVDDLYFYVASDAATLLASVQTGEYDMALDLHMEYYDQLLTDENLEVDVEIYGENGLYFNKHDGMFTNQKMRQAVNAALNVDDILVSAFIDEDLYEASSSYAGAHQVDWYSEAGNEYYNQ